MQEHDYDRFRVDDHGDMLALLRQALSAQALCTVRAAGRPETYLSPLRDVSDDGGAALDPPRVPFIERALTLGSLAAVELRLQESRLSFESRVAGLDRSAGAARLRLERPSTITRVRRRDTFRVQVPERLGVRLTLDAADPALLAAPMTELHLHGGSLSVCGTRARIEAGHVFEQARLVMPDQTQWPLAARVSHAGLVRRHADGADMRIGIQFTQTRAGFETAVADLVGRIARSALRPQMA